MTYTYTVVLYSIHSLFIFLVVTTNYLYCAEEVALQNYSLLQHERKIYNIRFIFMFELERIYELEKFIFSKYVTRILLVYPI